MKMMKSISPSRHVKSVLSGFLGIRGMNTGLKGLKGLRGLGAIYYRAGAGAGEVKFRGTGENRHRDRFYLVLSGKPTADLPVTAVEVGVHPATLGMHAPNAGGIFLNARHDIACALRINPKPRSRSLDYLLHHAVGCGVNTLAEERRAKFVGTLAGEVACGTFLFHNMLENSNNAAKLIYSIAYMEINSVNICKRTARFCAVASALQSATLLIREL